MLIEIITTRIYADIIVRFLAPEAIVNMMLVDHALNDLYRALASPIYEEKVKRHFPQFYQPVKSQPRVRWVHAFNHLAAQHYDGLSQEVVDLFLAAKTDNVAAFENLEPGAFYFEDNTKNYLIKRIAERATPSVMRFMFEKYIIPYYKDDLTKRNERASYTLFHQAVRLNQVDFIKAKYNPALMLAQEALNPAVGLLQLAASYGHREMVNLLIEWGADVAFTSEKYNFTALHYAAMFGYVDVISALLLAEADIESMSEGDVITPLYIAAQYGQLNAFNLLKEKGALLNPPDFPERSSTLLHYAVEGGNFDIVSAVIDLFGINALDVESETPLHWAASRANRLMYDFLIEKGANAAMVSKSGKTVLHFAVEGGNVALMKAIAKNKALLNAQDRRGLTPLHQAVMSEKPVAVIHALLEAGADPYLTDRQGDTPLHDAIRNADTDDNAVIEMLVAQDATREAPSTRLVNTTNNHGSTPLLIALRRILSPYQSLRDFRRIDVLLEAGAVLGAHKCYSCTVEVLALRGCQISRNALFILLSQVADRLTDLDLREAVIAAPADQAKAVNLSDISFPVLQKLTCHGATMFGEAAAVMQPILENAPSLEKFVCDERQLEEAGFYALVKTCYEKTGSRSVRYLLESSAGNLARHSIFASVTPSAETKDETPKCTFS